MSRLEKGRQLAHTVQELKVETPFNQFSVWTVESSNGEPYRVIQRVDGNFICECADFHFNQSVVDLHSCKHIYAVDFAIARGNNNEAE